MHALGSGGEFEEFEEWEEGQSVECSEWLGERLESGQRVSPVEPVELLGDSKRFGQHSLYLN